jgi:endonuclease/exonuclease/phosphatase family metal-dependent hydrolase
VCAVSAFTGCVAVPASRVRLATEPGPCTTLLHHGPGLAPAIEWRPADDSMRAALPSSCATVGPSVYYASGLSEVTPRGRQHLAVISWNVHVGGGDLPALVDRMRAGALTGGEPIAHFVLLLQEAFRSGLDVPQVLDAGVSVPSRIVNYTQTGDRFDVVTAARTSGLNAFYVPSMRNGEDVGTAAEDRGTAILSTLPLSDLTAIELPYARQRRVAAAATVSGFDETGQPWRLRVVSAHLEATTGPRSLWLFSSALRERQVSHLLRALNSEVPTIVGSDLNTWAGGPREPAFTTLQRAFPQTRAPEDPTFRFGLTLDYLFLRLPDAWQAESRRLDSRFGSDHHPLLALVRRPTDARREW